eukprot:TRINITY_DN7576_c0_g1_i2.p1 TRINITY_DN7576_c0_g1~~TRINITY_DN7576_c0_g1_i2.p1  ORF type:complete len:262 (+),score=-16.34 TRINITY_DN7576_c0_g1_i2:270-1055(+)
MQNLKPQIQTIRARTQELVQPKAIAIITKTHPNRKISLHKITYELIPSYYQLIIFKQYHTTNKFLNFNKFQKDFPYQQQHVQYGPKHVPKWNHHYKIQAQIQKNIISQNVSTLREILCKSDFLLEKRNFTRHFLNQNNIYILFQKVVKQNYAKQDIIQQIITVEKKDYYYDQQFTNTANTQFYQLINRRQNKPYIISHFKHKCTLSLFNEQCKTIFTLQTLVKNIKATFTVNELQCNYSGCAIQIPNNCNIQNIIQNNTVN